jgi:hypothetical protein
MALLLVVVDRVVVVADAPLVFFCALAGIDAIIEAASLVSDQVSKDSNPVCSVRSLPNLRYFILTHLKTFSTHRAHGNLLVVLLQTFWRVAVQALHCCFSWFGYNRSYSSLASSGISSSESQPSPKALPPIGMSLGYKSSPLSSGGSGEGMREFTLSQPRLLASCLA